MSKIKVVVCKFCGRSMKYVFTGQVRNKCDSEECRRKALRLYVFESRKRLHPELQHGVGSGNAQGFGEEHHSFKDGGNSSCFRGIAFRAHGKICSLCGETDEKKLCAHHLDMNRKNNSSKNLIVVCHYCHRMVCHAQKRDKEGKFVSTPYKFRKGKSAEVKSGKKSGNPRNTFQVKKKTGQSEVKVSGNTEPSRND